MLIRAINPPVFEYNPIKVVDLPIEASNLDGYWHTTTTHGSTVPDGFDNTSQDLLVSFGITGSGPVQTLRDNIYLGYVLGIEPTAKIVNSYLTLTFAQNDFGFAIGVRVYYSTSLDYPIPTDEVEANNMPISSDYVDWYIATQTLGQVVNTPALTGLIDNLIKLPGYTALSRIFLQMRVYASYFIFDSALYASYEHPTYNPPILHIEYR